SAQQLLRNTQEVIAEGEFRRGAFYHHKESHPASANRLQSLTDHYPLYSQSDEANWLLGDSYEKMGPRFRQKAGAAYARIVRDYPLSAFVENAKKRLTAMEMVVPEADPVAYNRMKYELENRAKASITGTAFGVLKRGPSVRTAARSGSPAMEPMRPTIPVSVPAAVETPGFVGDVSVQQVGANSALDTKPDARVPAATAPGSEVPAVDGVPAASGAPSPAATSAPIDAAGQPAGVKGKKVKTPKAAKEKKQKQQR
ncbi:MAG: hypothetical protein H7Y20_15865, partial [Bryobacteraceae bacterium]|nr:hypothetical protein [Bryobacteraceae bacterium]